MKGVASLGLLGRILLILALVMATEFAATTYIFERASQFALRDDEAQRMAEHLVVARRVLDRTALSERYTVARELSTNHFAVRWAPRADTASGHFALRNLQDQILHLEPELLRSNLKLYLRPLRQGGNIAGSVELPDRSVLSFHSIQGEQLWSLTFGRILTWILPTLVLVVLGALMIRVTLRPFRMLMRATRQVGTETIPIPVVEQGPSEIRALIQAFNTMQHRIHRLIASRTQALAAVGHDLRTPLARLQLRLDGAGIEREAHRAMSQDIEEMTDLLHSLQIYLSGESASLPRERIDIASMVHTLIDAARDAGKDAFYLGPDSFDIVARPVPIRRSLSNLIDNALHHGGNVRVWFQEEGETIAIMIDDDGPGIAADRLADVMQPFVRLDDARSRNTRGMGLGLAIVNDAVRTEGGTFSLENRPEGGLRAIIRLPRMAG
ncbi:MAG TPA: ATP-binding protein [Sphingobium sp.]